MSRSSRSVIRWVRVIHRWISMAFVVIAVVLIFQVLPPGPIADTVLIVMIALLALLAVSGVWMTVHHYVGKARRSSRATAEQEPVTAPVA